MQVLAQASRWPVLCLWKLGKTMMALILKLNFSNLSPCSFPCNVKDPSRSQRVNNLKVEHLKFKNGCKLFDKLPKRTCLSFSEAYIDQIGNRGMDFKETIDFQEISGNSYDLRGEHSIDTVLSLCSSGGKLTDKQFIMDNLRNCSRVGSIKLGKIFHSLAIKNGIFGDKFVDTILINMYAKCSEMDTAMVVFDGMHYIDVASCNCVISGYLSNGLFDEAFSFFKEMGLWDVRPNHYTYSIMISACGNVLAVQEGMQFHAHVMKMQYVLNRAVANSLLTMYSRFGMLGKAQSLFQRLPERNIVSWTAIISGLHQQNAFEKALLQFYLMRENGFEPNEYTFTVALSCCGGLKHCDNGYALHAQVIKKGMVSGEFVGTAIVDMYKELGQMDDAKKQLQKMGRMASSVPQNALIAGFVHNQKMEAALQAFHNMIADDVSCNAYTFSTILKACSSLPSLLMSKQIHCWIIKANFGRNLHVASSLIEAYAKCGNLADAEKVFNQILMPDVVAWNTMVKAYSQYGYSRKAVSLFEKMVEEGIRPTSSTFIAVLSACSHCGLVQEGKIFFESMWRDYSITPEETHYSCMVDLFSRSGQLVEALDFIKRLPINPTAPIWRPLLAGCRCQGNLQLGEFIANCILELDPNDASVYVTLSNMYLGVGRLADAVKQRELMEMRGVKKEPGCSWIEVNNKMYKFFSGDKTHGQIPGGYDLLEKLTRDIKNNGYALQNTSIPHLELRQDLEEKFLYHSEKLAVCFGLLNLPAGAPICVFKNIRVCLDCHTTMKHLSKIRERDIILRDNYRFHHFKKGCCSCGDFW